MKRKKYLSKEEVAKLRTSAKERESRSEADRLTYLCVNMALCTGLRVSEMAKVELSDIYIEEKYIEVWRLKRRGGPIRDEIAIKTCFVEHLKRHLAWLEENDKDCLFPGERGRWTKRGLQQAWQKACTHAGIGAKSIHCARHTLATWLLQVRGDLRMVQKMLGHTSPTTTANMYADVPHEEMVSGLDGVYKDEV